MHLHNAALHDLLALLQGLLIAWPDMLPKVHPGLCQPSGGRLLMDFVLVEGGGPGAHLLLCDPGLCWHPLEGLRELHKVLSEGIELV